MLLRGFLAPYSMTSLSASPASGPPYSMTSLSASPASGPPYSMTSLSASPASGPPLFDDVTFRFSCFWPFMLLRGFLAPYSMTSLSASAASGRLCAFVGS
ncbi:hypothetical protein P7K49_040089 [Saguinus oedipus]|uniref:Secreted protein n=1 Tax=Saguinus oedipus TaxID=9490 RepID=A0ABQ9TCT8_SAGOE|nr:hypothetical protein P7K49_040089 [Saguinus oedipus]